MRLLRNIAAVLSLALAAAITPAQRASAETLSDALVSAYRNSGLLEQQRALLRAKDEDVAIKVSALRPVLSYIAGIERTWTDPAGTGPGLSPVTDWRSYITLSAELLLWDFGQTQKQIEIAKETVLATREALVGAEQTILLNAVTAYLNVLSAQEKVALQNNSVRLFSQELRAAQDRFDVGEITQTEVALAQATLAAARAAEAAAQGDLMVQREAYKAAVGHYPGTLTAPPTPPRVPNTLEAAKEQARMRHPDVLAAKRTVSAAEMGVELARLAVNPTLRASASATRTEHPAQANQLRAGITLSGPIYSGGKISAAYRQAVANAEAQRAALLLSVQSVEQQVGNTWAQLAVSRASIEANDRQIRATQVALRGYREEASLGARTTLDVLNAEQDLLDARASAISARYDQYAAIYRLLSSMGLLTAEHLNLGIVAYDPEAYFNAVRTAPVRQVSPQGEKLDHILEALGKR